MHQVPSIGPARSSHSLNGNYCYERYIRVHSLFPTFFHGDIQFFSK